MEISDQYFYDRIARQFGSYKTKADYYNHFYNENPEHIFFEQLVSQGGKNISALDVGCADGRYTLKVAPHFKDILAVDISTEMLLLATQLQKEQKIENVCFQKTDITLLPVRNHSFDVVYCRRGPVHYSCIFRLLKANGHWLELSIGEQDVKELKVVFAKGQNFGHWDKPYLESKRKQLEDNGFQPLFLKEYFYSSFYRDVKSLSLFLEGVPIFKDYDPSKDEGALLQYATKMGTERGIELKRHCLVITAQKC
jgi:SAM-dependent methyltransferase